MRCKGAKKIFVVERVIQGQDYGPQTEGHYETCPECVDEEEVGMEYLVMGSGRLINEFKGGDFRKVGSFQADDADDDYSARKIFRENYCNNSNYSSWYLALYRLEEKPVFVENND